MFRLVTDNFENSKLFEGLVILGKKKGRNRVPLLFSFVLSLLFSCLPSCLLLSLVLPSLVFSVSVCLSVSVCGCVLLCVCVVWCCGVCVVVCCACVCVVGVCVWLVWCVLWLCGVAHWKKVCRSKRLRVYRHHAHMCYHNRPLINRFRAQSQISVNSLA